jgi:biotin transport system substrate-specific component
MAISRAETRVLADRLIAGESWRADAVRIACANVLMILCAQIVLPLPWTPVPVTGQTFGVLLIAVLLGARRGALVMGLYLLEGLAGLPVFAPVGMPGAARLIGPTAGYLLSYPLAAFVTGWLVERPLAVMSHRFARVVHLLGAMLAGEIVIFAIGCAWLAAITHNGWLWALTAGAAPFVPGELLKLAAVFSTVRGVEIASRKS